MPEFTMVESVERPKVKIKFSVGLWFVSSYETTKGQDKFLELFPSVSCLS